MTRRMLIDATHPEETRVTVVSGNKLEEFDYETTTKVQLKGNIYLAKVTRVEPSLQAAFVEYGGNRHGFLAFSEIHPDYYRIPVSDREDLVEEPGAGDDEGEEDRRGPDGEPVEDMGGAEAVDEAVEEAQRRRPRLKRQYKIQEVIKRRQVMLVQVVKEERGTKGAALTTYLSLAGRYCVLMPNTSRGGGVSRKIANAQDRKRLKSVISELETPDGMAVILRTAGAERSKAEIKRDFDYILKLWDDIRQRTLQSTAPALIHEEANLIKRSIRDLYSKDIEEVLVAGEEAYKTAKDFMKALVPSHAKKVQRYKDEQGVPLFHRYQVEQQLAQIHEPQVQLRSGGTIVIHQTEALVAIDVNSGRATRERHIEETALKTNLEAAEEVARQLRLRDLAGLIVIDFIDMDDNRNVAQVERKLKESLRRDRARIQVGRISAFGLMEMSRQRLRPSLLEAMSQPCPTCGGVGYIASTETAALICLRAIEEEGLRKRSAVVKARVPVEVALYILNHKRASIGEMEEQYGFRVTIEADPALIPPKFELTRTASDEEGAAEQAVEPTRADARGDGRGEENGRSKRSRRGGRRRGGRDEDGARAEQESERAPEAAQAAQADEADEADDEARESADADAGEGDGDRSRKRRKRGRRGGRRRNRRPEDGVDDTADDGADEAAASADAAPEEGDDGLADAPADVPADAPSESADEAADAPAKKTRAKRPSRRRKAAAPVAEASSEATPGSDGEEAATPAAAAEEAAPKPKRRRSARAAPAAEAADGEAGGGESGGGESGRDAAGDAAKEAAGEADAAPAPAKKARAKRPSRRRKPDEPAASEAAPSASAEAAREPAAEPAPPQAANNGAPAEPGAEQAAPAAPEAAEAAADPLDQYIVSDGTEKKADKPKRKGWWNRMLG